MEQRTTLQIDEIQMALDELLNSDSLSKDEQYYAKQYEKLYSGIITSKNGNQRFLTVLDQNRSKLIDLNSQIFRILSRIIFGLLDNLMEIGIKGLIDTEDNLRTLNQIVILSQTFYRKEEQQEERCCLSEIISYHSIWGDKKLWEGIINQSMKDEIEKHKQFNKKVTKANKKIMAKAVLTTYKFNLKNFGLNEFDDIIYKIAKKYDIEKEEIVDV